MAPISRSRRTTAVFVGFGSWVLLAVLGSLFHQDSPAAQPPAPVGPAPASMEPFPLPPELEGVDLLRQTREEAERKSAGCLQCHEKARDPHYKESVRLGCVDCHGGDATAASP